MQQMKILKSPSLEENFLFEKLVYIFKGDRKYTYEDYCCKVPPELPSTTSVS